MSENEIPVSFGRKVFFLHPPVVIMNQVIPELAQEDFEVYAVKDEARLRQILTKYHDSIVFAGINEGMREKVWEEWIRRVAGGEETEKVDIGIIASSADETLRHKYIEQFKIRCGFTVLRADIKEVIRELISILHNVNAKGRRKYIRAMIENETSSTVNFPINGTFINGIVRDVSVVGFSCYFKEDPEFIKNSLFKDIQIRLQSQLLKAEGIVFGSRMDGPDKIYVILFTQRVDSDVRSRIRKYIQANLQNKMDSELK